MMHCASSKFTHFILHIHAKMTAGACCWLGRNASVGLLPAPDALYLVHAYPAAAVYMQFALAVGGTTRAGIFF
jgi:hypothetical protein